jgi:hypothetical protein
LALVLVLAACSDNKKPNASKASGSGASSSSGALPATTSNSGASEGTTSASAPPSSAHSSDQQHQERFAVIACDLFDVNKLNASTGLTWSPSTPPNKQSCILTVQGTTQEVIIQFNSTDGNNDEKFSAALALCDSGSVSRVDVGDGAYVCLSRGFPRAGVLVRAKNVIATLTTAHFDQSSPEAIETTLRHVLEAYT